MTLPFVDLFNLGHDKVLMQGVDRDGQLWH